MKIIFFGSSEFSIEALKACLASEHEVVMVISTPDQKKGRGLKLVPTVVKILAEQKGLPVETPDNLKDEILRTRVAALKPDFFVVSSYGKFIPANWLKIPAVVALNVHPSLIPLYRGASPVNGPILNGDTETGVTIMEVTSKLDAGDIFAQEHYPLDARVDAEKLETELAHLSYRVLQNVFEKLEAGKLTRTPQKEAQATYAGKLTKEAGLISFQDAAVVLDRKIRGLKPWPGTYILFEKEPLLILEGEAVGQTGAQAPGTLLAVHPDGSADVAAGEGVLKIRIVKPSGKKAMPVAAFIHGRRLKPGFVFPPS